MRKKIIEFHWKFYENEVKIYKMTSKISKFFQKFLELGIINTLKKLQNFYEILWKIVVLFRYFNQFLSNFITISMFFIFLQILSGNITFFFVIWTIFAIFKTIKNKINHFRKIISTNFVKKINNFFCCQLYKFYSRLDWSYFYCIWKNFDSN